MVLNNLNAKILFPNLNNLSYIYEKPSNLLKLQKILNQYWDSAKENHGSGRSTCIAQRRLHYRVMSKHGESIDTDSFSFIKVLNLNYINIERHSFNNRK